MAELICPNCNKAFKVDESHYAAIQVQVRNSEFNKEIDRRKAELEKQFTERIEAEKVKSERDANLINAAKDKNIAELKSQLQKLKNQIDGYEAQKQVDAANLKADFAAQIRQLEVDKNNKISDLETKLANADSHLQLELERERSKAKDVVNEKDQEITRLKSEMEAAQKDFEKSQMEMESHHNQLIAQKDNEITSWKDFRKSQSTKMLGETLELHCATAFAQIQDMGGFPNATFAKDNTVVEGSKGDFVFKDYIDGQEYISVMLEMKNEDEDTQKKHKNEDFLKKLDQDRRRKGCTYAVLVSMLEQGNQRYDNGIVDMSHHYPNMYVIRPQFLIPMLRILSQSAYREYIKISELQDQLTTAREVSLDATKFWEKVLKFRDSFSDNMQKAHKKFDAAYTGIDSIIAGLEKQIEQLRKIKANFEDSEEKMEKAIEIITNDITPRKLTHGIPSLRKEVEDAYNDVNDRQQMGSRQLEE